LRSTGATSNRAPRIANADALKPLGKFFGEKPINEIEIIHVRMYQDLRKGRVQAHTINREVGVFQQVMREFDEWKRLESRYRQVPQPPVRSGHSLSAEEERRLTEVAFGKKKWLVAAHCMMIMLHTTMGFGELRQLRRRDVDMERGSVTVREGAKNTYRQRTIPLNETARESMTFILELWKKLGGSSDEHYILPHRPRGERALHWRKPIPWLLDEPTTSMHVAMRSIRKAARLPHFRVYDCRVQAITKLLSNPAVSPQTSKEISGHISQRMQDRYSIQQFSTKKPLWTLWTLLRRLRPNPKARDFVPGIQVCAWVSRTRAADFLTAALIPDCLLYRPAQADIPGRYCCASEAR
jgi:integrase